MSSLGLELHLDDLLIQVIDGEHSISQRTSHTKQECAHLSCFNARHYSRVMEEFPSSLHISTLKTDRYAIEDIRNNIHLLQHLPSALTRKGLHKGTPNDAAHDNRVR
jgi:hypothetical protein